MSKKSYRSSLKKREEVLRNSRNQEEYERFLAEHRYDLPPPYERESRFLTSALFNQMRSRPNVRNLLDVNIIPEILSFNDYEVLFHQLHETVFNFNPFYGFLYEADIRAGELGRRVSIYTYHPDELEDFKEFDDITEEEWMRVNYTHGLSRSLQNQWKEIKKFENPTTKGRRMNIVSVQGENIEVESYFFFHRHEIRDRILQFLDELTHNPQTLLIDNIIHEHIRYLIFFGNPSRVMKRHEIPLSQMTFDFVLYDTRRMIIGMVNILDDLFPLNTFNESYHVYHHTMTTNYYRPRPDNMHLFSGLRTF